jgi:hypothetical protein
MKLIRVKCIDLDDLTVLRIGLRAPGEFRGADPYEGYITKIDGRSISLGNRSNAIKATLRDWNDKLLPGKRRDLEDANYKLNGKPLKDIVIGSIKMEKV